MTFKRDWKEKWVDEMGLIVALSAPERFTRLDDFKHRLNQLPPEQRQEVRWAVAKRFTPSSTRSSSEEFKGCRSATEVIEEITS